MARQIDRPIVTLIATRNDDGTYLRQTGCVCAKFSEPAASLSVDKVGRSNDNITGVAYDGKATVDALLDNALAQAKTECGA